MAAKLTEALFPFLTGLATDGAYLILSGSLRVYYISEGREATLYTLAPGGTCILALSAIMNGEAYPG